MEKISTMERMRACASEQVYRGRLTHVIVCVCERMRESEGVRKQRETKAYVIACEREGVYTYMCLNEREREREKQTVAVKLAFAE